MSLAKVNMRNVGVLGLWTAALFLAAGCAAVSTTKPAAPESSQPASLGEYPIGPDDVLLVDVWKRPELSREITVRPDGFISLPLVKDVAASGLSASSLSQVLREKFKEFVEDPEVSVIVKTANSYKIYVLGKVTNSGMFTAKTPVSVVQAIAMAGGFTPFAKTGKLVILHRIAGKDQRVEVNYDEIMDGRHPEKNVTLRPGDTVIVP
jgi:polysaccharide biosynthesis/export protein